MADFGESAEVLGDESFVPGDEDGLDVGVVLVQRRSADPGLLGDLGHRHRPEPVLRHERGSGVEGRIPDRLAMLLDRLVPELRHKPQCTRCLRLRQFVLTETLCIDKREGVDLPITHKQADAAPRAQALADPVVSCRSLTKRYGDVLAADEYQAQ